jgi:hypothetical protein
VLASTPWDVLVVPAGSADGALVVVAARASTACRTSDRGRQHVSV